VKIPFKKIFCLAVVGLFSLSVCGCALIPLALSAAVSYGLYQATRK
jgi:EamA domain-containing membrane protein RarD